MLLSAINTQYFYDNLFEITQQKNLKKQIFDLSKQFLALLATLTENEKQVFVGIFSKINFIVQAHNLGNETDEKLQNLRRFIRKNASQAGFTPTQEQANACIKILLELILQFADFELDNIKNKELVNILQTNENVIFSRQTPQDKIKRLYVSILEKTLISKDENGKNTATITAKTDGLGIIKINIADVVYSGSYTYRMTDNVRYLQNFQSAYFTDLERIEDNLFASTDTTLIIASPDYLVDASKIAKCFYAGGSSPYVSLLDKMKFFQGNEKTLLGNLINDLLDRLVINPEIPFIEAMKQTFKERSVECAVYDSDTLKRIYGELEAHFDTVKKEIIAFKAHKLTTEPSFISNIYGLQGRLDLLVEYDNNAQKGNRKDIIELKSGKFPANNPFQLAWDNETTQVACYNLLIDSAFEDRNGVSAILYSRAKETENPLRDCGKLNFEKQKVMLMRNRLVSLDFELAKGNRKIFDLLQKSTQNANMPPYTMDEVNIFNAKWNRINELEKNYFVEFFAFVMRELMTAKIGGTSNENTGEGFAGLWKNSSEEKATNFLILNNLVIKDFDNKTSKITFSRDKSAGITTTFRKGDIVVVYPISRENLEENLTKNQENQQENETLKSPISQQILRGTISEISAETLVISLRNKFVDSFFFEKYNYWATEQDFMESGYEAQITSLSMFLEADQRKKNLLLGLIEPQFDKEFSLNFQKIPDLSNEQNEILAQALSAQDYFILQGPPGTGKTSAMLKNMVKYLYENTDETIVLLAFTNRATDEICEKIKNITLENDKNVEQNNQNDSHINFIRLGYVNKDNPLAKFSLTNEEDLRKVRTRLAECRVFVCTVSSYYKNQHLVPKHDTIIIDEASQLLEPHLCGILPKFKRFILVGDEKQLPAVVTQATDLQTVNNSSLKEIGISDLSISMFERLLINAQKNNWNGAFAMLSRQFRTHEDVLAFFGREFYDNKLFIGSERQKEKLDFYDANARNNMEKLLASNRCLFLPTTTEKNAKYNKQEAQLVSLIISVITNSLKKQGKLTSQSIGVITPYRAQIAEINALLSPEMREIITVDTVERYQGSERDIIIMSMAVNYGSQLTNLQSFNATQTVDKKFNVALSRAKEQIIILGNEELLQKGKFYKKWLDALNEG